MKKKIEQLTTEELKQLAKMLRETHPSFKDGVVLSTLEEDLEFNWDEYRGASEYEA